MKRIRIVSAGALGAAIIAAITPALAQASVVVEHGRVLLDRADVFSAITAHGSIIGGISVAALGIGSIAGAGNHAATSKWFRVAVEGATTDGRTIERDWITQMAATYNRDLYGARVNCEHMRGYAPMAGANPSPFGSYGDVTALRAEQIADGPLKGKYALLAQIQPTQDLIDLTKKSQKIYTSIEVAPSFADTKQAYMIGLAVTDSPASLGTEILQFAAGQGDKSPFAGRKQHRDNLFTAAEETLIEFEPATPSVFARVAELLGFVKNKGESDDKRFTDLTQAVDVLATFGKQQAETITSLSGRVDTLTGDLKTEREAHSATAAALKSLKETLSSQPSGAARPPATGSAGDVKTDC
ncbi:capsid scaffolding serine peptidase GPO [Paraburkholderia unamae]|uniref:GPO family capsid scaffolding protein n=1 Tax=Paraburkholderia unamae TaxID=219649 RepID=UPI000DC20C58|nr:GPO family capsid scaffolding protein [Paraburkholderia unamae]RAR53883.1 capsid scaffolding serine peptidase GPO [Paraburkholderia unamae]